jgi:hypothetical protein
VASDFTEVDNSQVDPENRNDTEFTWESTYDSEGNPDPEDRDDQDFSWESEPEEPTTVILQRGAHYDVLRDLNAITFVPGSACQMSQTIAYIRYWSRGGTAGKTPVETEEQSSAPTDPQQKLEEDVSQVSSPGTTNPTPQTTQPSTRTILTVPENRATGRRQPVPTQVPVTGSQPSPRSGKIVSANPSGTVNTAGVTASPPPADAVWMFLFNPEELQLSSGPDYNRAETWGVSDPKNSGQPLSWRSNRNRKLSFGKVLLHGYTFGKRVDTLEAGLQQLFMARDGENGSDGPPVLEFVWGKRVFGPCVIQNIQVREKAWDKGILVNAEVSFELEQVPEWTINDGYVDILRPGRQPLVNDPLLPQGDYEGPGPGDEKEKNANKKGGGNPKPTEVSNPSLCNEYIKQRSIFQKIYDNSNPLALGSIFQSTKSRAEGLSKQYSSAMYWLNDAGLYRNFEPYISKVAPGCGPNIITANIYIDETQYTRAIQFINGCANRMRIAIGTWLDNEGKDGGKCASLRKAREERERDEKRKAEKRKCDEYKTNRKPCTSSQLGSSISCDSVQYKCIRNLDGKLIWYFGV